MTTLSTPLDLHFVTPRLAVGADLDTSHDVRAWEQVTALVQLGITHVVDVRLEHSDAHVVARHAPHLRYLHHGMDDAGQRVPAAWFEHLVTWVEQAWRDDPDAVVLAHCHMGINRGPSAGFAVLLASGWDPVEAITAIRESRPQANVWYAADALRWHHLRTGADAGRAAREQAALQAWREANPLDVVRLIRQQRALGR